MSIILIVEHHHPFTGEPFDTRHALPDRDAIPEFFKNVSDGGWMNGVGRYKVCDVPEAYEEIILEPRERFENFRVFRDGDGTTFMFAEDPA